MNDGSSRNFSQLSLKQGGPGKSPWLKKIIWVIGVLRWTVVGPSQDSNHPDDLFQSRNRNAVGTVENPAYVCWMLTVSLILARRPLKWKRCNTNLWKSWKQPASLDKMTIKERFHPVCSKRRTSRGNLLNRIPIRASLSYGRKKKENAPKTGIFLQIP